MSEDRLNFDTSNNETNSNSGPETNDQLIVESTAEVINETAAETEPTVEVKKPEAPSYTYETYSTNAGSSE